MFNKNSNPFKNDDIVNKDLKEEVTEENSEIDTEQTETAEEKDSSAGADENNEELSKLQAKYDELNSQYIRLAADFDNFRKRQAQERENLISFGTENALTKLIEVLDNFERAQKSLENVDDCEKVKESFNLIQKQVYEILTKMGLEEIKAIGEEFDPNYHEAVMQTPTSEHPEHTVIAELRKGYKMGEKVLRPVMVNVAAAE